MLLMKYCWVEQPARRSDLREVSERFSAMQTATGPVAKAALLTDWLRTAWSRERQLRCSHHDRRSPDRIEGRLVEEAIAAAFGARLEQVKEVYMLTGDLGETARFAKTEPTLCREPHVCFDRFDRC